MRDFDECFDFGFGFGFGPQKARRGRRRRMRWRVFERGDLKFVILSLLAERPMHGYEVMKALEKESRGTYTASPGSVYPTLQMLEDEGYVTSSEDSGKRVYSVTDEGRVYLEENQGAVDDVFDRVSDFTNAFFGDGVKELSSEFRRLARITFEGAMRGSNDPETLRRMRDVLEEATAEMRRASRGRSTRSRAEEV
jgi:DNA-binding PadR family transcriptional regulator